MISQSQLNKEQHVIRCPPQKKNPHMVAKAHNPLSCIMHHLSHQPPGTPGTTEVQPQRAKDMMARWSWSQNHSSHRCCPMSPSPNNLARSVSGTPHTTTSLRCNSPWNEKIMSLSMSMYIYYKNRCDIETNRKGKLFFGAKWRRQPW